MKTVLFYSSILIFLLTIFPDPAAAQTTYIVDQGGGGDFTLIQDCIDAALDGDTCLVSPGTYSKNIDFMGKAITLQSVEGAEGTIIDGYPEGEPAGPVVAFMGGETESTIIDGFTITHGYGGICCTDSSPTITDCTITDNYKHSGVGAEGGGISCIGASSPTIQNCVIANNSLSGPTARGGGIYCSDTSSPTISNCLIAANEAQGDLGYGGGIYCSGTSSFPTIQDCTIVENVSGYKGGGIYCNQTSPMITNCTISENIAEEHGGGIYLSNGSSPIVTNCTIVENIAYRYGGAIFCGGSSPMIVHCTISWNEAYEKGGGIYSGSQTPPLITNCILWGDSAPEGPEIYLFSSTSSLFVSYSDVQGGEAAAHIDPGSFLNWLEGNIDADPLFVGVGDYLLSETSPCIDAGIDAGVYTDIEGEARPHGCGFDMGADENSYCHDCDGDHHPDGACGGDDCDDTDPTAYPGADDPCDGIDQACDGLGDEADSDEDTFIACADDCDDLNPDSYPGAAEICDGQDNDCNGTVPADEADADGDGYRICEADCDDANPATHLHAAEICDREDNDCDERIPDDEVDSDEDGWTSCEGDCNEGDPLTGPGFLEICDHMDNDCDEQVDEDFDWDGDGWTSCGGDCNDRYPEIHPEAAEVCDDSVDNDCDGLTDLIDPECMECTPGDTQPCDTGLFGVCADGTRTCVEGLWSGCMQDEQLGDEICDDGVDNDCDGLIDLSDPDCVECSVGDTQPCDTGLLGVCAEGTQTCAEVFWSDCLQDVQPSDEICDDGVDNDCDGQSDGDDPDCPAELSLDLDAHYRVGTFYMEFTISTPEPVTWANYLILTDPTAFIVPLWEASLPALAPPFYCPVDFPCPSLGGVWVFSVLSTGGVPRDYALEWVDTGK